MRYAWWSENVQLYFVYWRLTWPIPGKGCTSRRMGHFPRHSAVRPSQSIAKIERPRKSCSHLTSPIRRSNRGLALQGSTNFDLGFLHLTWPLPGKGACHASNVRQKVQLYFAFSPSTTNQNSASHSPLHRNNQHPLVLGPSAATMWNVISRRVHNEPHWTAFHVMSSDDAHSTSDRKWHFLWRQINHDSWHTDTCTHAHAHTKTHTHTRTHIHTRGCRRIFHEDMKKRWKRRNALETSLHKTVACFVWWIWWNATVGGNVMEKNGDLTQGCPKLETLQKTCACFYLL